MEEKRLDFSQNKVEVLTLEELAQTAHEDYHNGQPVMGIYHWQLIGALLESLEKANVKYEVQEIFAANNNSKDRPGVTIERRIAEEKGGNVLEAYTLRRVYANINLFDPCADDWQMNMAVAYHQSGIQVGFGPYVHVCHNQTILSAADLFSTNKLPHVKGDSNYHRDALCLLDMVNGYIDEHLCRRVEEVSADVVGLQKSLFEDEDFARVVTALVESRVRHDSRHKVIHTSEGYPLNQSQMNNGIERYLLKAQACEENGERMTYWEALQCFNYELKPGLCEIPSIVGQNVSLTELFVQEMGK